MVHRSKPINEINKFTKLFNDSIFINGVCKFDIQDPFDKTILKYIEKEKAIYCGKKKYENVIIIKGNRISIIPNSIQSVKCNGRNFKFKADGKDDENDYEEWRPFNEEGYFDMSTDFANIICYKKTIFNIDIKIFEETIALTVIKNISQFDEEKDDEPSVIMIGIDSMSRSNFIRSLPKTYKFLQEHDFIDFKRHVKVADNTYGNWIAILTGLRASWSSDMKMELTDAWNLWYDDFPLIWKNFTSHKYVTLFAEDRPDIATFNYHGKMYGFKKQPTTHYFRNFWLDVVDTLKYKQSKAGCYGSIPNTKLQLNYLTNFLNNYKTKKKFAWWWSTEMSHEYLNTISSMDNIYLNFFKNTIDKMKNSIIIVFSDHGHRYDAIRETNVGRYETRLPFLNIYLPNNLKKLYPFLKIRMIENSEKMTTQYDLHETLVSILEKKWEKNVTERRGYSLFHQHPNQRRCKSSGIPANYCPCNTELILSPEESTEVSTFLINYLNDKLINFNNFIKSDKKYKCKTFQLDKILHASLIIPSDVITFNETPGINSFSNHLTITYRLMVQMKPPSGALIEALIEKNLSTKEYSIKEEIERNNKYGNTSFCVNDAQMQKICHCYEI
ncbi:Protein of unknown function DUF229 family and Alkaline phosphatase-like, alpha/beta/alpha domain and Alkaline-phosphatase-like, core domain-containing protein [Strongyloides ratti]|uniref:Uncharacterized protein n=1 Tax=Strongyloides ratti TaxID=34506 RepID=A0A090L523_STRRB|nr:Protein of unknown function DUF229 family and Alkaline phosphatase-like, alpha/beta/alpha domain and Alkaline-phosphatase-like, core domain-containing protein [Strongyloides ratti]CEF62594.1 Protein of unknown function DUF229 family and Alkaline phosphatase-like, alpha/beta/alpha domain and Alkaline-phosphatase-like, core domain-containing protein [Strongyloides ratti]